MPHEQDLTSCERELERVLAAVRPAGTTLRMEQIEAEVDRRHMARQLWRWRGVAAVLVVGLGVSLAVRPQPRVVERLVEVPVEVRAEAADPAPPGASAPLPFIRSVVERRIDSPDSYIVLRERVMERGLDALPDRPPPGPGGPTPRVSDVLYGMPGGDV